MTTGSHQSTEASSRLPGVSSGSDLTQEAFDALLALLGSDRNQAARRYEVIRLKLIRLFAWRGWSAPEELADETLDRVAKKLQAGIEIKAEDPYRYISGVAYRVFKEKVRENERRRKRHGDYQLHVERELLAQDQDEGLAEVLFDCLKKCLSQLASDDRELILRYYEQERSARISNRKALAQELGLAMNNLRIRTHRIRGRLEKCTNQCAYRA